MYVFSRAYFYGCLYNAGFLEQISYYRLCAVSLCLAPVPFIHPYSFLPSAPLHCLQSSAASSSWLARASSSFQLLIFFPAKNGKQKDFSFFLGNAIKGVYARKIGRQGRGISEKGIIYSRFLDISTWLNSFLSGVLLLLGLSASLPRSEEE